jgi:LAO/AO transport system kinase
MNARGLAEAVTLPGDASRRALARLLSLCESRLPEQRAAGEEAARHASSLRASPAHRIGVTGPPGAGKSTLVEALGLELLQRGGRVGVLCVDPSSALTGGSILGDRTRMGRLAVSEGAFVRACASGGEEGGLTGAARHQLLALEAWAGEGGAVLVETVGVGQSEHEVRIFSLFSSSFQLALRSRALWIRCFLFWLLERAISCRA